MSNADLIRTLCEIVSSGLGDAMELGAMESGEPQVDYDIAQVNTGGKITIPASFDSIRELLTTLDDGNSNNAFLRKWLKTKLSKEEPAGAYKTINRGRGGRGGFRGQGGRAASRTLRYCEADVEEL